MFLSSTKIFEASQTNSVDPDQTAPTELSDLGPQWLPLCLCYTEVMAQDQR